MVLSGILKTAGFVAVFALTALHAEPHDGAWVHKRAAEWQPTAKDRSWENIGWASSLSEALALGKKHGRPIFLFTHDGRLSLGRC